MNLGEQLLKLHKDRRNLDLKNEMIEAFKDMKDLKKNFKSIVLDAIDWVIDSFDSEIGYSNTNDLESVNMPSDFWPYSDGHSTYIAKNVKGRGWPDYDEVVEKVAKNNNIPLENVTSYVTQDFFDRMWWDTLELEKEYWSSEILKSHYIGDVISVGRSGGYLAIEFKPIMLKADKNAIKSKLVKYIKKNIKTFDKDYDLEDFDNIEDVGHHFADGFMDSLDDDGIFELVAFEEEVFNQLLELDKAIEAQAKYWEKPDYWVEHIEANGYWDSEESGEAENVW